MTLLARLFFAGEAFHPRWSGYMQGDKRGHQQRKRLAKFILIYLLAPQERWLLEKIQLMPFCNS